MGAIEALKAGLPDRGQMLVRRGRHTGAFELAKQLLIGVIGEADVGGEKLLVKHGSPKESGKLLFFDRVAGERENVADAGKNESSDLPFEGLEEGDLAVLEGKDGIALADFDAIFAGDGIDVLRVEPERIERGKKFARRNIGSAANRRH